MKKLIITVFLISISFSIYALDTVRFAMEASYPPFEFVGKNNEIQGFDVDLATALCKEMQVKCTFTNQAFDSLIPSLIFKQVDAVISGMDITAERLKQVAFTEPYYENSALLIAEKSRAEKEKLTDLAALKGKRVGLQNGSTHQRFLQKKHPEIMALPYSSYQDAVSDLKSGRLDAVFGDTAVINEWLKNNDNLTQIGEKITDADYFNQGLGIAVRQENTALLNALNAALVKVKKEGAYQALYNKWFSADNNQAKGSLLINELPSLAQASLVTISLALCALIFGLVLAVLFTVLESSGGKLCGYLTSSMVTLLRGLPEILVLLCIYFGSSHLLMLLADGFSLNFYLFILPVKFDLGIVDVSPFLCGVIALALLYAAYASQTLRGALKAVPIGQWESAQALGLSQSRIFFRLIMPQMWRHALPGLGNQWLVLLKDTALVSLISVNDLMLQTKNIATRTQEPFTWYCIVALVYLAITLLSQYLIKLIVMRTTAFERSAG